MNHEFDVTLIELVECDGVEGMNYMLDDALHSAGVKGDATDISYEVRGVRADDPNLITIRAEFTLEEHEDWSEATDAYNGRRVEWTDPDGGHTYSARVEAYDPEDETFWLSLDTGGETEVPRTEVEFI